MKTIMNYLEQRKDEAYQNRYRHSGNYLMTRPAKGSEKEYAEAVRDCEIVEELLALVRAKEMSPKHAPSPSGCPECKLKTELEDAIRDYGVPSEVTVDYGNPTVTLDALKGHIQTQERQARITRDLLDSLSSPLSLR